MFRLFSSVSDFACLEGEHIAASLLYFLIGPALAAHGHIPVIAADFDLLSLSDYISMLVYAGVDYGLAST